MFEHAFLGLAPGSLLYPSFLGVFDDPVGRRWSLTSKESWALFRDLPLCRWVEASWYVKVGLESSERLGNVPKVTQEVGELQAEPWVVWPQKPRSELLKPQRRNRNL